MKKFMVVVLLGAFIGCSTDDDVPSFFFERIPVESVTNIPETFQVGELDTLQIRYIRPTSCHGFEGFEIEREDNSRNISLITRVIEERAPCQDLQEDIRTVPLVFRPEEGGSVILRFYQGDDIDGNATFLTVEVPILD